MKLPKDLNKALLDIRWNLKVNEISIENLKEDLSIERHNRKVYKIWLREIKNAIRKGKRV